MQEVVFSVKSIGEIVINLGTTRVGSVVSSVTISVFVVKVNTRVNKKI